jgi:Skp family chaperone for outer membrane proteins
MYYFTGIREDTTSGKECWHSSSIHHSAEEARREAERKYKSGGVYNRLQFAIQEFTIENPEFIRQEIHDQERAFYESAEKEFAPIVSETARRDEEIRSEIRALVNAFYEHNAEDDIEELRRKS